MCTMTTSCIFLVLSFVSTFNLVTGQEPGWQTWVGVGGGVLGAIIIGILITVICVIRRKRKRKDDDSVVAIPDGEESGTRDIRTPRVYGSIHSEGVVGPFLKPSIDTGGATTPSVKQPETSLTTFSGEKGEKSLNTYDYTQVTPRAQQTPYEELSTFKVNHVNHSVRWDGYDDVCLEEPSQASGSRVVLSRARPDEDGVSVPDPLVSNQPTTEGHEVDLEESRGYSNHTIKQNKLKQKMEISISEGPSVTESISSDVKADNSENNYSTLYELDKQEGWISPKMVSIDTSNTTGEDSKYDRVHLPNVTNKKYINKR